MEGIVIKYNKKSVLLIASLLIFLLVGAVSAAETPNETVAIEDNTLSVSQNYSSELNSHQESLNNEKSFNDLQTTVNSLSDNDVLDLDCDYKYNGK